MKTALSPHFSQRVIESMSSSPFSLMMDESNDKTDKSCIILSRFLDPQIGEVRTRFLDMPVVNIGTAANLFQALNESLAKNGLGFSNAVAFMSDTTNVMKGKRSGVQKLIRDENPFLLDVGCICHLADLTVKAGLETLPVDIDQLFIDIFYFFQHSSKRKQHFVDQWCSMFTTEPDAILKHCPTRWLSILRCVKRYLKQFDGLRSFFLSCEEAETAKVQSIVARLDNPLTKPLLHFLSFILPSVDKFNRLFQKSTQNTTSQLYDEMNRLVRLYASNFLTADTILEAGANLKLLKFDASNHLANENLGIGTDTWASVSDLEESEDPALFFNAVRNFYQSSTKKMLVKFPFGDSLMKDMRLIQPRHTSSFSVNTVISLATRFPQIGLNDSVSLDRLREEFLDFKLTPAADLPEIKEYKAADGQKKPKAGLFWLEVGKMKTMEGQPRFYHLQKLVSGLMSIPISNADSERAFSILRKIHTDQRSNLDHSTVVSLMALKFNLDECCLDVELSEELLKSCKQATKKYVIDLPTRCRLEQAGNSSSDSSSATTASFSTTDCSSSSASTSANASGASC